MNIYQIVYWFLIDYLAQESIVCVLYDVILDQNRRLTNISQAVMMGLFVCTKHFM